MMGIKHGALGLALLVVLAACTQATADQPDLERVKASIAKAFSTASSMIKSAELTKQMTKKAMLIKPGQTRVDRRMLISSAACEWSDYCTPSAAVSSKILSSAPQNDLSTALLEQYTCDSYTTKATCEADTTCVYSDSTCYSAGTTDAAAACYTVGASNCTSYTSSNACNSDYSCSWTDATASCDLYDYSSAGADMAPSPSTDYAYLDYSDSPASAPSGSFAFGPESSLAGLNSTLCPPDTPAFLCDLNSALANATTEVNSTSCDLTPAACLMAAPLCTVGSSGACEVDIAGALTSALEAYAALFTDPALLALFSTALACPTAMTKAECTAAGSCKWMASGGGYCDVDEAALNSTLIASTPSSQSSSDTPLCAFFATNDACSAAITAADCATLPDCFFRVSTSVCEASTEYIIGQVYGDTTSAGAKTALAAFAKCDAATTKAKCVAL